MQLDKDTLIKHRFWILLGLVLPIFLIILVLLPMSVGSATEDKQKKVEGAKSSLNIADPKNEKWIAELGRKDQKLTEKRDEVWMSAWRAQSELCTWPDDPELAYLRNAPFGDAIDRHVCTKYAGQQYQLAQARDILKVIRPATRRTPNGAVLLRSEFPLRVVPKFTRESPPSEELWLAQEDLWVQRELLQVVRDANDSVGVFKVLPNFAAQAVFGPGVYAWIPTERYWPAAGKLDKRQRFYNANWELDLTLTRNGKNEPVLRGTITNLSKRKLTLGMEFDVQLQPQRQAGEVGIGHLLVDGEAVAAGKSVDIKESASLVQAAPTGLFGVEQLFTWKTAPVKRLDQLALFHSSHRTAHMKLQPARQFAQTDAKPADGGAPAPSGGEAPPPPTGGVGALSFQAPPGGAGSPEGGGTAGMRTTPSGLVKDRYLNVTDQVRRMPVALTVTVEQSHIPNVIAAFSNSKLRMQVMQVHMVHVRSDSLRGPEGPGGPVESGVPGKPGGPGFPLFPGGGAGSDDLGTGGDKRPGLGGVGGIGVMPSGPPTGAGLFPAGAADDSDNNLVELTVYAIASLYERPPKPATAGGEAAPAKPAGTPSGPG